MGKGKRGLNKNPYKQPYRVVLAASVLALAPFIAFATDQTSSQQEARRLNDQGSDDSLDASYGNALQAVGHFYNLNIPGAIQKGVKAYGQYKNSEELDTLRDKNKQLAGSMASVGAGRPEASGITGESQYVSPYARLDRKFLYRGETGKIAEKIEKLSGLSRERMFQMAVDVHTNSKSIDDPEFVSWGMKTYRGLVKQVPNDEFRSALSRFGDLADKMIATGAVEGVLAQFRGAAGGKQVLVASAKPESIPAAAAAPVPEISDSIPSMPPQVAQGETPAGPERTEDPASSFSARGEVGEVSANQRPGFDRLKLDPEDKFFESLAKEASAARAVPEDTIFRTVSRKIREVSDRQYLERMSVAGR